MQSVCRSVLSFLRLNGLTLKVRRSASLQLDAEFDFGEGVK